MARSAVTGAIPVHVVVAVYAAGMSGKVARLTLGGLTVCCWQLPVPRGTGRDRQKSADAVVGGLPVTDAARTKAEPALMEAVVERPNMHRAMPKGRFDRMGFVNNLKNLKALLLVSACIRGDYGLNAA